MINKTPCVSKAIFLDRDGVINELVYFPEQGVIDTPFTPAQFRLCPGVAPAVKRFQKAGYKVIVISNQPGIAKKHMTLTNFNKICGTMKAQLAADGAELDGEYYCLHHPEAVVEKYKKVCDCRKPKPGLLLQAAADMAIDLSQSWFIGDNLSDVKAGQKAGCHTMLIGTMKCDLCNLMDQENTRPETVKSNLMKAADFIIGGA
jgi:D-glycero-D-manno-heptose 1,7-bisphosphate phosphatase